MGGKLVATAFDCLCARSSRSLTHSLAAAFATRPSLTPTISQSLVSRRPSGIGRSTSWQKGRSAHCLRQGYRPHLSLQVRLRGHGTTSVRAASGVAGSTATTKSLQRKVSHILVKPDQDHILDEVEDRLAGGEEFRMLAGELSECRGSRMQGGLVGWIERGQTAPMFEEAAFEANIGELVRAETHFGLHLIKVEAEREQAGIMQMSVSQLADILQDPDQISQVQLVDVREEVEESFASLPHFQLKPLSRMRDWERTMARELDPAKHTILLCHHGMRSQQAAQYLESLGFSKLSNVQGGIDAYSLTIDPTVPMY